MGTKLAKNTRESSALGTLTAFCNKRESPTVEQSAVDVMVVFFVLLLSI